MRSSTASLLFGALIAVSLVGKAVAQAAAPAPDAGLFARTAAAAMHAAGLQVSLVRGKVGTILYGRRGQCLLMVRDTMEGETYAEAYRQSAAAVGPIAYLYRGRWSPEPPPLRPIAEHYLRRGLGKLGLVIPRAPLVAAAATPGCDFRAVDWPSLRSLPR